MGKNLDKILQKLRTRWRSLGYFDLAFVLFFAQEFFVLICVIVVLETFRISGILVIVLSLGTAIAFDRVLGKILTRVLRRHLAFFFYLIFQISLFGLISTAGLGLANVPKQTIYASQGWNVGSSLKDIGKKMSMIKEISKQSKNEAEKKLSVIAFAENQWHALFGETKVLITTFGRKHTIEVFNCNKMKVKST